VDLKGGNTELQTPEGKNLIKTKDSRLPKIENTPLLLTKEGKKKTLPEGRGGGGHACSNPVDRVE